MQVKNQKPVVLSPVYQSKITGDYEPSDFIKETISDPIMQSSLLPGTPVSITDDDGNPVTTDSITDNIVGCCGDIVHADAEKYIKSLLGDTLLYFDKTTKLTMQNLFAVQAAKKENLPYPSKTVIYTPAADISPVAKGVLAGTETHDKFFCCLDFYARPEMLGYSFINDTSFDNFKQWLAAETNLIAATLPSQTTQLLSDFQKLSLDKLTESIIIRNDDNDNNDELSFARLIVAYLNRYISQPTTNDVDVLPFNTGELFCPKTLVFVNIEKHAHATARQISDEWDMITKSLQMRPKVASNKKLSKLTATMRIAKNARQAAATAASNAGQDIARAANVKFRNTAPSTVDIVKLVKRVMSKMANVAMSQNSYKSVKMTFAKPNRRNPDDYNKQGKMVSMKYKPDIHVYLDTSGSISEENYEETIKALIKMAMKLNVNFSFNTFSHFMSQETKLNLKNKSAKQIYAQFQKTPKATGGTDYEQIWHYINRYPKRKRELSLIITDFEWWAPNKYVEHPKNLYYLPISKTDWDYIKQAAESFCQSMVSIDPDCRKHILF